ncbi:MAG: EamA family transporter RarD [Deltaproteobacteria bacterium]|nr:EamA family transporter RarD [Deltaproteobacteria bacterium]
MEFRRGIAAGIAAYTIWGCSPIYWNLIREVPPPEALAWRVVWALLILLLVLAARRGFGALRRFASRPRTLAFSVASGGLLALNWGLFLWAVTSGHIVEVSLGYYINPLMSVALGVVILREHLNRAARIAVSIAAVGVGVMAFSGQRIPWIALSLAVSFALYGLMKKKPDAAPPLEGLLIEAATVAVPVAVYLTVLIGQNQSVVVETGEFWGWIPWSGAITVAPLLLFGIAAQRIPLSTVGMLQYLAPTIQLLLGIYLYGESMSGAEMFGFASVWLALGIFAFDGIVRSRASAV